MYPGDRTAEPYWIDTDGNPITYQSCKVRSKDAAIAGKYKTTSNLYLRVGAGTGKTAITLMPAGSSVQCYGYYTTYNGTRWYYVAYGDKTGFCSSAYLRKA